MLQNVKVSLNRSVTPKRIVVGNQFESGVEQIHFDIPDMEGYKYLVLNKPNKEESYPIPLDEGTFYVDSRVTYYLDGVWIANIVISKSAVTEGKLNPDVVTFISDDIILIVKNNYINNEYLKDLPLPQNIQIVYDKLFDTYTQIKSDYDSGAFDGKDGYSPTLDVTPIDNGNRITINDINGEKEIDVTNGIDGQSAYELAVKNGFEGTEEEWLESLRYDHSEEFTKLAEQVKQDANSAADSATKAENAMNEANTTAQENVEAINQASTNAQNAITTTKDNAVQAVQSAQQTAENAIGTKQTEAVQAVDTAKTSATQEITEQKESAVSAITQERSEAIEAIETGRIEALNDIATDKTGALEAIETVKDEAIEEIENTGVPLEDIEKLAIKETAEGNPTIISDSADWRLQKLNVYGQSEQDSTTGAQLLSLDMLVSDLPYSVNGITFSDNEDGGIKVTGTATSVATLYLNDMINNLADGETYSYNSDTELGALKISYNDGTPTDYIKTVTVDKSKMIRIEPYMQYASGNTVNKVLYPILNAGNSAKPWEQYTGGKPSPSPDYPQDILSKEVSEIKVTNGADLSQTITLTEPITLRGIPVDSGGNVTIDGQQYIADVITEKDGVIGVERNVSKAYLKDANTVAVSKDKNWYDSDISYSYELQKGSLSNAKNGVLGRCEYFKSYSFNNFYRKKIESGIMTSQNDYIVANVPKSLGIVETVDEFKQWVTDNNVYIERALSEPTFEPLPDEIQAQYKALKSYYPNTVIQTDCWNEVTFIADTKMYIEKKFDELNANLVTTQSALLDKE